MLWCLAAWAASPSPRGSSLSYGDALSLVLLFTAASWSCHFNSMAQTLVPVETRRPLLPRPRHRPLRHDPRWACAPFSGISVGLGGGLIGIHWSLAISTLALFLVTLALAARTASKRATETITKGPRKKSMAFHGHPV